MRRIRQAFETMQAGELPQFPPIELYIHTPVDPTLQDDQGRHSAAFFVQWVPYELNHTRWEDEEGRRRQAVLPLVIFARTVNTEEARRPDG